MDLPIVWAFVILIIVLILYKLSLRQLHSKLKPVKHDDGKYSNDEVKANGKYWDDNFGDMDNYANYGIGACAVLGLYFGGAASAVVGSADVAPSKVGGSPVVQYA